MTTLFYIFGFLLFVFRLPIIYTWKSIYDRSLYIVKWEKVTGKKYIFDIKKDLRVSTSSIILATSIIWSLIGLFSSNWFLFSLILELTIIMIIFKKLRKLSFDGIEKIGMGWKRPNESDLISSWLMITINTAIIILIVLNYFYLDINFINYFRQ